MTHSISVLHVDDEPYVADLTGTFFERQNDQFAVETATSADEGLEMINDRPPECVISDYDMPGMDGIEFLQAVREEYPDLPFILFTGKGSEAVASEAISAGATDYLQKGTGSEQYELLTNRTQNAVQARRETQRADRREQQMRMTELGGGTGGFELDTESGEMLLTDGFRDLANLPAEADLSLDDAIGLYHPEDREDIRQTIDRTRQTGEQTHGTWRLQAQDGEQRLVDVTFARAFTNGDVTTLRGVVYDITEQKNREEKTTDREQTLQSAYEIIADGDRSVSEQLEALLEVARDHIGTDYATFSHIQDDQYEFERVAVAPGINLEAGHTTDLMELPICERVFQTGEPLVIGDVAAEAPELVDPEWGIACYLGAPVVVNDTSYGTFCFYDVEPRSEAFSEWEQTFVELLGDWVGAELTRRQATEQLQQQNEQLEEFANVVSHDLRNPLNIAQGRLELAQGQHDSEHLNAIGKAHTRMEVLIEDLLTLAREGHGVTEFTAVDLSALIDNCWATVETNGATLVTDTDRTVQADRSRLKQLCENLIRNAVEHGSDDVTVTVGAFENGFYIADDGPGIPQAKRDDVFEVGFSTNTDGTGLGLSIVKQGAEAHNWGIQLSESENGGAQFEITGVNFADS
jgi:CheY-like chemotaxis protein/two-component sensor histidine kinase